jgi:DeoR/GlpR family transcriptional regulator of sugar metabolism
MWGFLRLLGFKSELCLDFRAKAIINQHFSVLAPERHQQILQLVAVHGSVRTAEVARSLGVTEETVRRDLEKLETEGKLNRTHGGAMRGESGRRDLPFTSRESMNVPEKRALARHALRHIESGDTILLDASSTALEFARQLPDLPITVLTNALKIAIELSDRAELRVVMVGGVVAPRSLSCVGPLSDHAIECINVQKAFFSCRGVDATRGLSESDDEQARFKRRILALSERTYLLADHTKLGLRSAFFFAPASGIDILITDRDPAPDFAAAMRAGGVEIQIASPE